MLGGRGEPDRSLRTRSFQEKRGLEGKTTVFVSLTKVSA